MTDRRPEGATYKGARGARPPVPKDPPDQQIQEGEDPLDVPVPKRAERKADGSAHDDAHLPDPDESGAGRADRGHQDTDPDSPEPQEPSG
ncbi:MAG TPA: hypothetical protein VIS29_19345 [Streptomyces sp.]